MEPTVGRIVHVFPAENDELLRYNGAEVVPAIITRVWTNNVVNVRVFTDGPDVPWNTSVSHKDQAGEGQMYWDWPEIKR